MGQLCRLRASPMRFLPREVPNEPVSFPSASPSENAGSRCRRNIDFTGISERKSAPFALTPRQFDRRLKALLAWPTAGSAASRCRHISGILFAAVAEGGDNDRVDADGVECCLLRIAVGGALELCTRFGTATPAGSRCARLGPRRRRRATSSLNRARRGQSKCAVPVTGDNVCCQSAGAPHDFEPV